MPSRRLTLCTAAVVAILAVPAVGIAGGGVGGKITIQLQASPNGDKFAGKVKSEGECKSGRLVKLLRNGKTTATDRTNGKGNWVISLNGKFATPGDYVAKAVRKNVHDITCKTIQTAPLSINPGPGGDKG
jgi:hypothetical protein